jgi:hypothetical protein
MEVVVPTPYDVLIEQCLKPNVEGAYERAQEAIRQGADVNRLYESDGITYTPILLLIFNFPNNLNFIQLLLDAGADPNIFSGYGNVWAPLSALAHKEYHEKFSRGENNNAAELAKNNALYEHKKALIQVLLNSEKLNANSVDPDEKNYCYDLIRDPKLLLEFIVKRNPSVKTLDLPCFDYDRTLLSECCLLLVRQRTDTHFYERVKPYADIISTLLKEGVNVNILDRLEHTALDYIDERLPEIIPLGDLPEQLKIWLATWNMLVDHGAMTRDELLLRETPAIKRTLGRVNNENNFAEAAAAAGAPSPQAVRHAFLRDWAQQVFSRAREFGGRRVRARRVSRSRRHRRKTQRKSKNR